METLVVAALFGAAIGILTYAVVRRSPAPVPRDEAALRAEVERYRAAIRAGTLCRYCNHASPAPARHCMHCGRILS